MKKAILLSLFLCIALTSFACNAEDPSTTEARSSAEITTESETTSVKKMKAIEEIPMISNATYDNVRIERKDFSIKTEVGEVLANIYYDLPQVAEDSSAAKKINDYLTVEFETWRTGYVERYVEWMEEMREDIGDSFWIGTPANCLIDMEIMYCNPELLSIRVNNYVRGAGSGRGSSTSNYNFSMKTGELVPFTEIVQVEADAFKQSVYSFLFPDFLLAFERDPEHKVKNALSPNANHDFKYEWWEEIHDWSYQYFYDGRYIYLTMNDFIETAAVCKWNGRTGDDFQASLWYVGFDAGTMSRMVAY